MNEKTSTGVKIHDIHHGLVQSTGAIVESEFGLLKELGAAVHIATTIKDHDTIKETKQFYAAAGELKIPRHLANIGLTHLEKLGFVRLRKQTGRDVIDRIDVTVPNLFNLQPLSSKYYCDLKNTSISTREI